MKSALEKMSLAENQRMHQALSSLVGALRTSNSLKEVSEKTGLSMIELIVDGWETMFDELRGLRITNDHLARQNTLIFKKFTDAVNVLENTSSTVNRMLSELKTTS
jgi:hypothetical protein